MTEPWELEEWLQVSHDKRIARRPRCTACGGHIQTERYLDLEGIGGAGFVCERCIDRNMFYIDDWEEQHAS